MSAEITMIRKESIESFVCAIYQSILAARIAGIFIFNIQQLNDINHTLRALHRSHNRTNCLVHDAK